MTTVNPLSIALTGLRVAQAQIGVASNNIANVSTDGYSRKTLQQYTSVVGLGEGAGAATGLIQRRVNDILVTDYRKQISLSSGLSTRQTYLQQIQELHGPPDANTSLSAELGKQVMIDLEGGDVELDREMIETIRDPLTHIIRNAIDHGIETPSHRLAAGKREIGTLHISARQSGNRIILAITDDGRGIDGARLVEKAVGAGAISASEGETLGEAARHALIFEPGLSTAANGT